MMSDLNEIFKEIQDYLVPILDTYEQAIYHYLFRHSHLEDGPNALISVRSMNIGLGISKTGSEPSFNVKQKKLRNLEKKGCIEIIERSSKGTLIKVLLPSQIEGLTKEESKEEINIEKIDFYNNRQYLEVLLKRENYRCFYSLQKVTPESCVLDHVVPQSKGEDNSYKNIVAASHDANSQKNDINAEDFIRYLYREQILSMHEMKERLNALKLLQDGKLKPQI